MVFSVSVMVFSLFFMPMCKNQSLINGLGGYFGGGEALGETIFIELNMYHFF